MPWKIGGNFEIVPTKCEENWRECAVAIANYLWCEMVSDVVDCLGKEGMIWVLIAMAIASTILLRVKYRGNAHTQKVVLGKQMLTKVGCKIHDLELKVNVLTYKMQYGTWPLPHQIYSLNPKKLRKIRMTLSNPGDHKSWINQVLLSPMKSNMCVPYPNIVSSSEAKLPNNFSDTKGKHIEYNGLTDCSSIEMSKSTSDQSVNLHSQAADTYLQNASTRDSNCSKSEDVVTLRVQSTQLSPSVLPDESEGRSSKTSLIEKHVTCSTLNAKYNPCQEFEDTIHQYKSFLKELRSNRHSHLSKCSSKLRKARSVKQSITSFATQNGDASHDGTQVATVEKEEAHETRCAKGINNSATTENGEETYRPNAAIPRSNDTATFSEEFYPTILPAHNVQSSQETLHEIKRRLQSLHNVLQTYQQDANRYSERDEELERDERIDEVDASIVSIGAGGSEDADRCKTDTDCNVDSQENPPELQRSMDNCEYHDHSDGSLSSLTGCSSSTSKTYRCSSNTVTRNPCSKESSHCIATRRPVETSDLPAFPTTTKLPTCKQSSRLYSFATSSEDCTNCKNEDEKDACRRDVTDGARGSDTRVKINEDVTNANGSFHLEEGTSETISEKLCCIPSPGSFKGQNVQTQNGISPRRFVDNEEQKHRDNAILSRSDDQMLRNCQKSATVSQSDDRTLNEKDREEKSTTLLLQEALRFQKILLTRVDLVKGQPTRQRTSESDIADESIRKCEETERRGNNDNFPSMILDIKTKKPINGSCERMNQHYVYLEMKQRRDPFLRSRKLNTLTRYETEEESQDRICEASSKYFSITDFGIRDDDNNDDDDDDDDAKIGSNVLSSLEPPIYEKVISIAIPVDARSRDDISAKDKSGRSTQTNDAVAAGDIRIRANSAEKLRRNRNADDIGDNVDAGRSPTTRKLEDLVLERIENIRDYMDVFLRNRNEAISKVRRALQYRGESIDATFALRCSNEASHVMLHERFVEIHDRDTCIDRAVSFSSDSPDLSLKTWPNRREVLLEDDDILKYCSNIDSLERNPERFALIAPTMSDSRSPKTTAEPGKKETVSSSSMIFELPPGEEDNTYKNETKPTRTITNLEETRMMKRIVLSEDNDRTSKRMITDMPNADSRKHKRQTQDAESKPSAIASRRSLDGAETDREIDEIVREKPPAMSNDNSTSNSSSYFTNATVSSAKMDDVFPKSTLNLEQSIIRNQIEQSRAIGRENNFVEEFSDVSVKLSELLSNLEYSSLKTLADSNLVPDGSECDCSTSARATLNENIISYDPFCNGTSPRLFSLNGKEETPKTDDDLLSNIKRDNEIFTDVMHSSPETEAHSTGQLLSRTYSRMKAKSDVSLTANRGKEDLNVNLYPRRSLSFLARHDSLAHVQRTLHQSHINVSQYDNEDKFTENKVQSASRSKSEVPPQRTSTRSCIPISKNRLERVDQVRRQTQARSPTRSPLTVSCGEKTFSESDVKEDEEAAQTRGIPNRHLHVEETALDRIELDMRKDIFDLEKIDEANTTYRGGKVISDRRNPKLLSNENIVRSSSSSSEEEMCSATDFSRHKNNFWIITVDRTEKEVTAKPSITDTYTSMSEVTLETN